MKKGGDAVDRGAESYRRFLEGDDSGMTELVSEYRDGLILYLASFAGSIPAAEELAEDAFVRLGVRRPHFSGRSSFRTWLYAIGRNLALDRLRRDARHGTVPIDGCAGLAELQSLEAAYLREERKIVLHRAMECLKAEYRQVLWLLYFEGFSDRETARIMKKSPHGVETLAYRARRALKAELIREGFSDEDL